MMRIILIVSLLWASFTSGSIAFATENPAPPFQVEEHRKILYMQTSAFSHIPWEYLAAIDQYERTLQKSPASPIAIDISERKWSGWLNPQENDTHPKSIQFFDGLGRDGSGDGIADRKNDADILQAIAAWILKFGMHEHDIQIAMWEYYGHSRAVQRISQFAKIYAEHGTLNFQQNVFPLPIKAHYTYRGTWGAARGWGGRRIHEGTDIFAGYGVPVRSVSYGVIETIGWNVYGGWRIGIRDIHNVYHYYAHLAGFQKTLREGDVVKAGSIIGWVGSSGYGKPGTSGKFPPHLHYGTYRDHGQSDWAFDPYPKLRANERLEKQARGKSVQH